jgi:hypothetical protein
MRPGGHRCCSRAEALTMILIDAGLKLVANLKQLAIARGAVAY